MEIGSLSTDVDDSEEVWINMYSIARSTLRRCLSIILTLLRSCYEFRSIPYGGWPGQVDISSEQTPSFIATLACVRRRKPPICQMFWDTFSHWINVQLDERLCLWRRERMLRVQQWNRITLKNVNAVHPCWVPKPRVCTAIILVGRLSVSQTKYASIEFDLWGKPLIKSSQN